MNGWPAVRSWYAIRCVPCAHLVTRQVSFGLTRTLEYITDSARHEVPMSRVMLIFNPMADHARSGQKASDLRAIVEEMGGADWRGTEYPAHGTEIAAHAADEGYEVVAALGGDGTVHEVVNGLM